MGALRPCSDVPLPARFSCSPSSPLRSRNRPPPLLLPFFLDSPHFLCFCFHLSYFSVPCFPGCSLRGGSGRGAPQVWFSAASLIRRESDWAETGRERKRAGAARAQLGTEGQEHGMRAGRVTVVGTRAGRPVPPSS